jgi:hypothetical protein
MLYWTFTWSDLKVQSLLAVQGASDHHGVILEVEWEDTCSEPQVERAIPVHNKTDVSGLQNFLRDKFVVWQTTAAAWRRYGIITKT